MKAESFEAGQYVLKQGESGDKFYLIAEGNLIAEKQETGTSKTKKVFEYQVGDYFGEIALIKNTVRQASIQTVTKCKLMSIDRDSFKRLLGPIEDILMRNMERYKKYMDQWKTTIDQTDTEFILLNLKSSWKTTNKQLIKIKKKIKSN